MCREASGHVIIQYLLSMLCDNRKTWFSCLLWKAEYKSFAMRYILYMWMYFCVCMNVLFDHGWVRNHWWFVNQGKVMGVYMRTWNILNTRESFWQCIEMNPIKISIFCFKFCCYCCCCFIKLIYLTCSRKHFPVIHMYGRNERQLCVRDIDQDSVLRPLHDSLRIIQLQFLTHHNIVV